MLKRLLGVVSIGLAGMVPIFYGVTAAINKGDDSHLFIGWAIIQVLWGIGGIHLAFGNHD